MEVRDRRMLNTQVSEATIPLSPELPSLSKLHRQLNHKHAHTADGTHAPTAEHPFILEHVCVCP